MSRKVLSMFFVLAVSIVVIFAYANAAEAQFVTDGLVGYWSFDGGSLGDAAGGHDGTLRAPSGSITHFGRE